MFKTLNWYCPTSISWLVLPWLPEIKKSEVNFEAYTAFTPKHCLKSGADYS